jgi:hypothetical protein
MVRLLPNPNITKGQSRFGGSLILPIVAAPSLDIITGFP